MASSRKRLGELLAEAGAIDSMQLQAALGYQRQWGGKLGSVLVERGFIAESRLVEVLATQLRVPVVQIFKARVDPRALTLLPAALCEQLRIFPLELRGPDKAETLIVAMSDPTDLAAVDQLQFRTRKRIQAALAGDRDIGAAIRRHYYNEDVPAPPEPEPIAAPPRPKPGAQDEFFKDMHLLGSEVDSDMVPGLMAWGEGEVKSKPRAPSQLAQGAYPAPPVMAPAFTSLPYTPQSFAPQGSPVIPAGIPPGFIAPPRGRPMLAPPGSPLSSIPPAAPPRGRSPEIDPFSDIDPDVDPLQGVDPVQRVNARSRPGSKAYDLAEPSPADDWTAIEPVAAALGDNDPLGGSVDMFSAEEPVAGEELEELDVDVNIQEVTGVRSRVSQKIEISAPIDAAAEGWLTPTEDAGAVSADDWSTPSENAAADPWGPPATEGSGADVGEATQAWTGLAAHGDTAPADDWAQAAPAAEIAPIDLPEDSAPPPENWLEAGRHAHAEDTSTGVESWLEPIAATVGMEPVGPPVEAVPLVTDDVPVNAGAAAGDEWSDGGWSEPAVAPAAPWPVDAVREASADPVDTWATPAEVRPPVETPVAREPAAEPAAWDMPALPSLETPVAREPAAETAAWDMPALPSLETPIATEPAADTSSWDAPSESAADTAGWPAPAAEYDATDEATTRISVEAASLHLGADSIGSASAKDDASELAPVELAPVDSGEIRETSGEANREIAPAPLEPIETPWQGRTIDDVMPEGGIAALLERASQASPLTPPPAADEPATLEAGSADAPLETEWPSSSDSQDATPAWGSSPESPVVDVTAVPPGTPAAEESGASLIPSGEEPELAGASWGSPPPVAEAELPAAEPAADWSTPTEETTAHKADWSAEPAPVAAENDWSTPSESGNEALGWADPEGTVPIEISPAGEPPLALVPDTAPEAAAWAAASPDHAAETPQVEDSAAAAPVTAVEPPPESEGTSALAWAAGQSTGEPVGAEPTPPAESAPEIDGSAAAWALASEQPEPLVPQAGIASPEAAAESAPLLPSAPSVELAPSAEHPSAEELPSTSDEPLVTEAERRSPDLTSADQIEPSAAVAAPLEPIPEPEFAFGEDAESNETLSAEPEELVEATGEMPGFETPVEAPATALAADAPSAAHDDSPGSSRSEDENLQSQPAEIDPFATPEETATPGVSSEAETPSPLVADHPPTGAGEGQAPPPAAEAAHAEATAEQSAPTSEPTEVVSTDALVPPVEVAPTPAVHIEVSAAAAIEHAPESPSPVAAIEPLPVDDAPALAEPAAHDETPTADESIPNPFRAPSFASLPRPALVSATADASSPVAADVVTVPPAEDHPSEEEGFDIPVDTFVSIPGARRTEASTIPGGPRLSEAAEEAIALAAAAAAAAVVAPSVHEPAPPFEVVPEAPVVEGAAPEAAAPAEPTAWPTAYAVASLPVEPPHAQPAAFPVVDEWAGFGVPADPAPTVPPFAAATEPAPAIPSAGADAIEHAPPATPDHDVAPPAVPASEVVVSPSFYLPEENALVEMESVALEPESTVHTGEPGIELLATGSEAAPPLADPAAEILSWYNAAAPAEVEPQPPLLVVPPPSVPASVAPQAMGARGWGLLGIAQPTADDAVQVMGALVELLVSRGTLTPAELMDALRTVKDQNRPG